MLPSGHVQSAFGGTWTPVRLPGGQGEAFRCGDIVLKPCHDAGEAAWIAQLHLDLVQDGFRLSQPVAAAGGAWVVDGWQGWTFVEGEPATDRWSDVIATCRAFHRATASIPRPGIIDTRRTPFARADRIAWGEDPPDVLPRLQPLIERLQSLLTPVDLPNQVIHGDFTGNVLFATGLPPAVIDISPYWRPAEYAQAIVVTDALDWHGADTTILELVGDIPYIDQLLVRAEIFRLAILDGLARDGADVLDSISGHLATVDMLTDLLGGTVCP